jgi:membrane dipeptidase
MRKRGWSRAELAGLAGGNVLRVLARAEAVAAEIQAEGAAPAVELYAKRKDLPARGHGKEL